MGKNAKRKPRPQPPKWYWLDSDNCYFCKKRNNCNSCRVLKQFKKTGGKIIKPIYNFKAN